MQEPQDTDLTGILFAQERAANEDDEPALASGWLLVALEEWKHLEQKVTRHAQFAFQTRGWMFALLTALQIGARASSETFSAMKLVVASLLIIAMFLAMELIQRVAQAEAISRSRNVERALRGEQVYDGPRVSDSLHMTSLELKVYLAAAKSRIVVVPFLSTTLIAVVLSLWSAPIPPLRDDGEKGAKQRTVESLSSAQFAKPSAPLQPSLSASASAESPSASAPK
jgi:hypothetical protein